MLGNDSNITKKLLDYLYYQKYYNLIDIDLTRETNASISQQINFVGKSEEHVGATMFFVARKL